MNINTSNVPLIYELSASEQEKITGGQDFDVIGNTNFFLQKTDIDTTADQQLNTGINESNSQNSKYNLSQITIGFSFSFGFPKQNFSIFPQQIMNFLPNLLKRFIA